MTQFTNHKILLVEDEPILQKVTTSQLRSLGFKFEVVCDGLEAVEKLTGPNQYDLVLMDVQLPGLNGLEATELIRSYEMQTEKSSYIPIIAITAGADKEACLKSGMNDFLKKPVMLSELQKILSRWLEVSSVANRNQFRP